MSKRRTSRKVAMQLLYQADFRGTPIEDVSTQYFEDEDYVEETKSLAIELAVNTWAKQAEIDLIIEDYSIEWDLDRMNKVDKSLLRLCFYEILFFGTPPAVALNETLELAKKFSGEDSPKFINGIIGKYVEEKCLQES